MRRESKVMAALLCMTAMAGCASNDLPPEQPDAPAMHRSMAAPPMPPMVVAMAEHKAEPPPPDGIVRLTKAHRVGASWHVPAGEDRVYRVQVGTGTATSGPQQVAIELPPNEQLQFVAFPNKELLSAEHVKVGNARDWHWIVFVKPLADTGGARVENLSLVTDKANYRVDVRVVPGRANNMTLKLIGAGGGSNQVSLTSGIAADALCADNNFSWDRSQWWAPMSVCVSVAPGGVYQTIIQMPPNIGGGTMPVVHAYADMGDGKGTAGIINYRVKGTAIYADGVHPALRLTGEGPPIDIIRGAGS